MTWVRPAICDSRSKACDQIFMEWQTAGLTPDPISVFGSARKQIAGPLDESIGPALVDSA